MVRPSGDAGDQGFVEALMFRKTDNRWRSRAFSLANAVRT